MKLTPFVLFLLSSLAANCQKIERYYTFEWKECDLAHARYIMIAEHSDSGWHRSDYYVHGPTIQMDGWYEDTAWKIGNGHFVYAYPDKKVEMTGRYTHGQKDGLWMSYHYNGMLSDSTTYANGHPIGMSLGFYPNGMLKDSNTILPDGSGTKISWHTNGTISSAGILAPGGKKNGKWQFWHNNGKLSAIELYDHDSLLQWQYFDENGSPIASPIKEKNASFKGGANSWLRFLDNKLYWPKDYQIANSDEAAVVVSGTVDEDGNVVDVFISTPFFPTFDKIALDVIRRSPKWDPAIEHNRRVPYYFLQPVIFHQQED